MSALARRTRLASSGPGGQVPDLVAADPEQHHDPTERDAQPHREVRDRAGVRAAVAEAHYVADDRGDDDATHVEREQRDPVPHGPQGRQGDVLMDALSKVRLLGGELRPGRLLRQMDRRRRHARFAESSQGRALPADSRVLRVMCVQADCGPRRSTAPWPIVPRVAAASNRCTWRERPAPRDRRGPLDRPAAGATGALTHIGPGIRGPRADVPCVRTVRRRT